MGHNIYKRDGREVEFDGSKIESAVLKAFMEVDGEVTDFAKEKAHNIALFIEEKSNNTELGIEDIQDLVEKGLMATKRKDVAKAYILYRDERSKIRHRNSPTMQIITEKLSANNVQNQNANVDEYSFGGRRGEADSAIMKQYALDYRMSKKAANNHKRNRSYMHDLDSYELGMHNCLSVPLDHLLNDGFNTRQTDIRPANSINTAFQLVAVLFQIQSLQQFGGVSATHLDWTMVPFVRKSFFKHYIIAYLKSTDEFESLNLMDMLFDTYKDEFGIERNKLEDWIDENKNRFLNELNLTIDDFNFDNKDNLDSKLYQSAMYDTILETKQAAEAMYHNLNSLQSRSGNQLPFSSINYGTCTLEEGRLVTKTLLDASLKGVGKLNKPAVFPCGIFQYMKGVNDKPGTPNYDLKRLALRSTSKRIYPNYANVDWSGNAGYDINDPKTYFSTMGCRTANGFDANGFGQLKDGRGNIAPATIIMPTLAMEAKEASENSGTDIIENFMTILETVIYDTKESLEDRFEWICSQDPRSAKFMWENNTMAGYIPEEGIKSAMKHGTLAIGNLGLAETLQILIGKDHTTDEGMKLAKRIYKLFADKCKEFKEEDHIYYIDLTPENLLTEPKEIHYKLNFGVYNTPAENLCYTAMCKFKDQYGVIPNVSDKDFFTNSMHVPVWKEIDPFTKIDIESQLTGYSSAGCITYCELDGTIENNIDALEQLVDYAMEKDIPYFAVNIPLDTCLDCGFTGEYGKECPKCGSDNKQELRRVTGYLTGDYTSSFNKGKRQEVQLRYRHSRKSEVFN